ncbi:MAG: zinc-ribbon domain-containing protein, partial [Oscillospiraceae bacterium]|nr:zinc-ribbon domain-containing protein [Oscillospiraceae bacterium]
GYNDLETIFPNFLKEWNYKRNTVLPNQVIARSGKKYWWICELGHEWQVSPLDRTYGRGCPICSSERKVSIGEKTILYYIMKNYNGKIIPNYRSELIDNKELDIYLPELKIGIEYDGVYFHKNRARDLLKDNICKSKKIRGRGGRGSKGSVFIRFRKQGSLWNKLSEHYRE